MGLDVQIGSLGRWGALRKSAKKRNDFAAEGTFKIELIIYTTLFPTRVAFAAL